MCQSVIKRLSLIYIQLKTLPLYTPPFEPEHIYIICLYIYIYMQELCENFKKHKTCIYTYMYVYIYIIIHTYYGGSSHLQPELVRVTYVCMYIYIYIHTHYGSSSHLHSSPSLCKLLTAIGSQAIMA